MIPRVRQRIVSAITKRYPFLSGCATIANSRLVRLAAGDCAGLAWSRLDCGAELLVPLDDFVGRAAYFVGDLDRKISGLIKQIVRPGDHVLDIGANLGIVTVQLARLVGEHGVVHAFEPNPAVRELLSRSIERNHFENVTLHTCALGSEEGTLNLNFPEGNAGEATLTPRRSREGWRSIEVPVRPLSSLMEEHDFRGIRLVKMDVEGFELEVLRGARRWLSSHPPDVFLFEANDGGDPAGLDPVVSQFSEQGYALYTIPKRLLSLELIPYRPEDAQHVASHDMLAVREEREREVVSLFRRRGGVSPAPRPGTGTIATQSRMG